MYSTILAAGAIAITSICLYGRHFYYSLARETQHSKVNSAQRASSVKSGDIESFPTDLINRPEGYRVLHERDEKTIPGLRIQPSAERRLFTKLLRRNMICFARTPQSWAMWLMLRKGEHGHTFSPAYIKDLDFQDGDLFCGVYQVRKRTSMKVEIAMRPPEGFPPFGGLLVVAAERHGDGVSLRTETVQWVDSRENVPLPLDKPLVRFLHEIVAWWLLVSGARYLTELVELEK